MINPLVVATLLFAILGLAFLFITIKILRMRKILTTALSLVTALLMLSLSALFATISAAIQGYTALTREGPAAEEFRVMVSTTGLWIRRTERTSSQ